MKNIISAAFTGYRREKLPFDCTDANVSRLRALIADTVRGLSRCGVKYYMAGMCPGVDMWAALTVLELREECKIELWCAVPFDAHRKTIPASELAAYDCILQRADGVRVLAKNVPSSDFARAFNSRNRYMVDRCGMLIAVCDPDDITPGGTRNTVLMARGADKKILYINPKNILNI